MSNTNDKKKNRTGFDSEYVYTPKAHQMPEFHIPNTTNTPAKPDAVVRPAVRGEQKLELFTNTAAEDIHTVKETSDSLPPNMPEVPVQKPEPSAAVKADEPELLVHSKTSEQKPEVSSPSEPEVPLVVPAAAAVILTQAEAAEPEVPVSAEPAEPKTEIQPIPSKSKKKTVRKVTAEELVSHNNELAKNSRPKNEPKITKEHHVDPPVKKKTPKEHTSRFGKIVISIFLILMVFGIIGGFCGTMWFENLIAEVPPLDIGKREEYSQASSIYDYNGAFVAEYGTNENVEWADSDDIPQMLKDAFTSIEDQRFYEHNGIDLKRLVGAVIGQVTGNASYGASTITQQLIKNTHLTQEVSYTRKAMEIHLALELEKEMSKDDILVWYMNTLYLGDSNYGVKVAAKDYFGKELSNLSLRECAILAGLAQSPNAYNPRLNLLKGNMEPTNRRANDVLYAMHNLGKISDEQYEAALNETLNVQRTSRRYELYDYPIFVEYAVENVAKKLLEAEGTEINDDTLTEKKQWLRTAGYKIYTGFNTKIQDITQDAITNFDKYPHLITGDEVQASAVIMDQRTGEVVAMVGGREEPTAPEGFNRATDSTQAVGSSIKPLSVYAPACETGDYPGTTVMDTQESIEGYGEDNSYPNGDHTGAAITMRRALELSHNIPAARFLLEHVGIDKAYDFMVQEGFAPSNLAKTAAGLALGATDVTTLEMTGAYACLANGGVYIEPHAYRSVTDRFGNEILNGNDVETHRVFSESTAWLVTDMMHSNMTDGYGVNARLSSVTSAGKTGTHEHQVISFGGYTPYYTSFVRISADDYVTMTDSSSFYQSAPLWKAYMEPIHEGLEDREIQDFTAEDVGIKQYWVCTNSGQLAQDWCEGHYEYAAPNNAPTVACEGHTYAYVEEWNEWDENYINYDDPNWWEKGWWDEQGNFHPY